MSESSLFDNNNNSNNNNACLIKKLGVVFLFCLTGCGAALWLSTTTTMTRAMTLDAAMTLSAIKTSSSSLSSSSSLLCTQNPYLSVLGNLHQQNQLLQDMESWLDNLAQHLERANQSDMQHWNHERFLPFEPLTTCPSQHQMCLGGPCGDDVSKIACGVSRQFVSLSSNSNNTTTATTTTINNSNATSSATPPCIVYSIGGNNHWEFELDVLRQTPCQVHSFDCTGPRTRFEVPHNPRLVFHYLCLGATQQEAPPSNAPCRTRRDVCGPMWTLPQIQRHLNHHHVDLFKMDIEGFEWPLFEAWQQQQQLDTTATLPMQMLVEIHYRTQFKELAPDRTKDWKTAAHLVLLQAQLTRMGYATVVRDDNAKCRHCTELTLLRVKC